MVVKLLTQLTTSTYRKQVTAPLKDAIEASRKSPTDLGARTEILATFANRVAQNIGLSEAKASSLATILKGKVGALAKTEIGKQLLEIGEALENDVRRLTNESATYSSIGPVEAFSSAVEDFLSGGKVEAIETANRSLSGLVADLLPNLFQADTQAAEPTTTYDELQLGGFEKSLSRSTPQSVNVKDANVGANGNSVTGNSNGPNGFQFNNAGIVININGLPGNLQEVLGNLEFPFISKVIELKGLGSITKDNELDKPFDREQQAKVSEATSYLQELKQQDQIGVTFALAEDNTSITITAPEGKGTRGIYEAIQALAPSNALNDIEIITGGDIIILKVRDPYSRIDNQNKAQTIERVFKQLQNAPALFDNATFPIGVKEELNIATRLLNETQTLQDFITRLKIEDPRSSVEYDQTLDILSVPSAASDFSSCEDLIVQRADNLGLLTTIDNLRSNVNISAPQGQTLQDILGLDFIKKFKTQGS